MLDMERIKEEIKEEKEVRLLEKRSWNSLSEKERDTYLTWIAKTD